MTPEEFKQEVMDWAAEVGVQPGEIHLRDMTRKIASCSSRGRLTFDPSLMDEPEEVRAKAILHELLHLRYPNHGRMHRVMLETYLERRAP